MLRTGSGPGPIEPGACRVRTKEMNMISHGLRATVLRLAAALSFISMVGSALAEPITITVASFPDLDRAAKAALPRWNALHPDITVKVVSLQYADHHTAMTTALATGSGLPDVMAVDFRFLGKFGASQGFEDLLKPPYQAGALRDKFVRYTFPQATNARGELIAMPADIGPGTLLYRKDLLDKAGISEAQLTTSWESFIEAGKTLKAKTGVYLIADSADIRDIVLRSGLKDGEGIYFDRSGKVLVDSPRFVRAFELGRAAHQAGIAAGAVAWTNEWTAGFKQNHVAAQMMGAWLAGHLKNWLAPDSAGLWRSANLPGGVYGSYGGSFYAIPKKSANKAAAWAFIRFMTLDRQTQVESLRVLDSFPSLLEAQTDPLLDEPVAFLGGQRARQLWREIASKVPDIPVHPNDAMATDVIRAEYENVVAQGKDVKAALADARDLIARRSRR
jgi:multiple sugar transport system substrate-binding protein